MQLLSSNLLSDFRAWLHLWPSFVWKPCKTRLSLSFLSCGTFVKIDSEWILFLKLYLCFQLNVSLRCPRLLSNRLILKLPWVVRNTSGSCSIQIKCHGYGGYIRVNLLKVWGKHMHFWRWVKLYEYQYWNS